MYLHLRGFKMLRTKIHFGTWIFSCLYLHSLSTTGKKSERIWPSTNRTNAGFRTPIFDFFKTCRFADLRTLRILLKLLNFAQKRNMVSSYNFVRFLLISLILTHLPIYRDFISGEPLKIRKFSYRNLRRQRNLFKFQNFAQKRYMVGSYNFVRFSLILQI